MTNDEHMAGFLAFVGAVVRDFQNGLHYRQAAPWLTDLERNQLVEEPAAELQNDSRGWLQPTAVCSACRYLWNRDCLSVA